MYSAVREALAFFSLFSLFLLKAGICQCLKTCWVCVSWISTSSFNKLLDLKSIMLMNYNYLSRMHIRTVLRKFITKLILSMLLVGIKMCEFNVILDGKAVFKDVVYAKTKSNNVIVKTVLGESREFKNCKIMEIDVNSTRLVLSNI